MKGKTHTTTPDKTYQAYLKDLRKQGIKPKVRGRGKNFVYFKY